MWREVSVCCSPVFIYCGRVVIIGGAKTLSLYLSVALYCTISLLVCPKMVHLRKQWLERTLIMLPRFWEKRITYEHFTRSSLGGTCKSRIWIRYHWWGQRFCRRWYGTSKIHVDPRGGGGQDDLWSRTLQASTIFGTWTLRLVSLVAGHCEYFSWSVLC